MREMKSKVMNAGAKLRLNGEVWSVVTCLFADDTVLLAVWVVCGLCKWCVGGGWFL